MADTKWYHNSFRRNLIDMHIPDWNEDFFSQIDPVQYVEMLKKANVDTAYIYTTSCVGLCNFPTKVGKMHAGLKGRDIIKEITDGCRKAGIRPILYINIWSMYAYLNHPEWRCKAPDGRESIEYMFGQPGRYGVLCPNTGYREYVLALVRELMENYETDGLWIDMLIWRTICTCPSCKKRFKDETGFDIPENVNLGDKVFTTFMKKRDEWMIEFFNDIKAIVCEKNPDASVVCNSAYYPDSVHGTSEKFSQQVEFITGDSNMGPVRSFEAKLFNNITRNHPFEFLCSVMDPALWEHSMLKTEEHLLQLMTSCIAHNGRNGFIDAIDPYGSLNPAVYEHLGKVYKETDKYIPFLEPEMDMCADVAIYTNFHSTFSPDDDGKPLFDNYTSEHMKATMEAAARLVEQNIPFDVITSLQLGELSKYKALILADAYVLKKEETDAIREYVRNGGNLYASSRCAIYDYDGGKNSEGNLSDVLGVKIVGKTSEKMTYIRPVDGVKILPDYYTPTHPLSMRTFQSLVEADADTKILGKLTLPIVHPEDTSKFASAISDPPGKVTEYPSLTENTYGKGKVYYCAGSLELLPGRDHGGLFARLLKELIGDSPAFITDAPYPVELVLYRQKESGNYVINLSNSTLPILTIPDINVKVRIPEKVTRFYTAPDGKDHPFTRDGDYISFSLDRLRVFGMFIAETE